MIELSREQIENWFIGLDDWFRFATEHGGSKDGAVCMREELPAVKAYALRTLKAEADLAAMTHSLELSDSALATQVGKCAEYVERMDTLTAELSQAEKEREVYAELAAGKCVIQKVIDQLGPQTLCSVAKFTALTAELSRAEQEPNRAAMKMTQEENDYLRAELEKATNQVNTITAVAVINKREAEKQHERAESAQKELEELKGKAKP